MKPGVTTLMSPARLDLCVHRHNVQWAHIVTNFRVVLFVAEVALRELHTARGSKMPQQ